MLRPSYPAGVVREAWVSFDSLGARRGRTGRVLLTPVLVIAILTVLLSLRTLAFASPPDPVWVAGIYDGKDGDDVIARIAARAGANSAATRLLLPAACPDPLVGPELADYPHRPAAAQARGPPGPPGVITTSPSALPPAGQGGPPFRPRRATSSALASPAANPDDRGHPLRARGPPPPR